MNIAIIQFPGSNCERETMLAVQRAGMIPVEFLWNEPLDKLKACEGYIIVGGFSYEDRSRAGIIAALDPILIELKRQSEAGKPILGICNGAQILVEAGLVPGILQYNVQMALSDNQRIQNNRILGTGYYNAWIHLKQPKHHRNTAFTGNLSVDAVLKVPVAHAEGRFVIPPVLLDQIETNGLVVFQYCTEAGDIINEFPVNPNGSVNNIAAITNLAGNVLAIMPHPERTPAGDPIFHAMRDYIAAGTGSKTPMFLANENASPITTQALVKSNPSHELIIELMIADNQALSVLQILRKKDPSVRITRQVHWDIHCQSDAVFEQIKTSHILYNDRKERVVQPQGHGTHKQSLLVRAKEDLWGRQALQQLKEHLGIDAVSAIQQGVLWTIEAPPEHLKAAVLQIIQSGILFNPASHDCYDYE